MFRSLREDAGGVAEIAPGDGAVTVLSRTSTPDEFGSVLADRAGKRIEAALPLHFTVATMASRYAWLYPRAIASATRPGGGEGFWLITNNLSIGGAQTSARRLLLGLAARGVPVRAAVFQEEIDSATPGEEGLRPEPACP